MSSFEFDGDDDDSDNYYLVAEEGTANSNGYGMFVDRQGRVSHQYYSNAPRFDSEDDAEKVVAKAEQRNGGTYEVVEITHE